MKISKLFHWLYAILMLMPFVALAFNFVRIGLSGEMPITSFNDVIALIRYPALYTDFNGNVVLGTIYNVYGYLNFSLFGLNTSSVFYPLINGLLTYWTFISIVYLVFDVLMYVPLLVHRWIDKARLE